MAVYNLDKILRPQRVAVVGASDRQGDVGYTVLRNLAAAGFQGDVFPVHCQEWSIQGTPAHRDLSSLPAPVDLAVVCSPAGDVPQIVRECGEARVGGVLITSAGFREIGRQGQALERRIQCEAARFPGLRILGPKSLGVVVPHLNLNASYAAAMPKGGRVAFVSQSGTLCTSALDWAIQEEIGFSHFVSIGNMLDVSVGDLIDYFAADPQTDSIILFLESITGARQFMSAARAITKEKPIVVYKAGRFSESAQAAVCHTGAMAGVDEVYEAAFERAGIVRVTEIDDMFDCAQLLARRARATGPRLAIITNAGGPGVVATDCLIERKGILASLSPETIAKLNEILPPYWSHANPVDILGDAPPSRFARAVEVVMKDPGVDAVLVILTPQAMTDPTLTAASVAEAARRLHKPALAAWMGGGAVRVGIHVLNEAGIPTYTTPKNAVHAFMHLVSYTRNRETLYETPRVIPMELPLDRKTQREFFNSLRPRQQPPDQPLILSEAVSKKLLSAYGIPVAGPWLAQSADEAVQIARQIGYPVVLKISSPQITHKNEVGGVALNIASDEKVRAFYEGIVSTVRELRPDAQIEGVTVQPMVSAPDSFELILGSRKDPIFGAVIMVGAGGVAAELLGDRALGLPPLNERLARRMLQSLRSWPILAGFRRRRAVDIDRLIETVIRFSCLVADCPQIAECDVNPLLVSPREVIALDARIKIDSQAAEEPRRFAHLAIRPYPEEWIRMATLKDGTPVLLRPIKPEDEPLWHEMMAGCSPESIRFRFRSLFKAMSHEMAARYCFIDYDRELAIVAAPASGYPDQDGGRKLIGVGQLVCDADHVDAEFAVLVTDAWQGRGLGGLLTDYCLDISAMWGLRQVVGETERTNARMLATFKRAGFDLDYDPAADVVIARKRLRTRRS